MSTTGRSLTALRWTEDMLVVNPFGDRVWLKPCFNERNERIGITDCCFAEEPCDWHAALAQSAPSGEKS